MLEGYKNVIRCWHEINYHQHFEGNISLNFKSPIFLIDPVLVNDSGVIDTDSSKNVNLNYWCEVLIPKKLDKTIPCYAHHYGGYENIPDVDYYHEHDLDCGGVSYEDCIVKLHSLFIAKYGHWIEVD